MQPTKIFSYDPDVDIAMICIEQGHAVSEKHAWGLIDRDRDSGRLMGFEIWGASTVFPREMLIALQAAGNPHGVAA